MIDEREETVRAAQSTYKHLSFAERTEIEQFLNEKVFELNRLNTLPSDQVKLKPIIY